MKVLNLCLHGESHTGVDVLATFQHTHTTVGGVGNLELADRSVAEYVSFIPRRSELVSEDEPLTSRRNERLGHIYVVSIFLGKIDGCIELGGLDGGNEAIPLVSADDHRVG